jgi:hypothetical protein
MTHARDVACVFSILSSVETVSQRKFEAGEPPAAPIQVRVEQGGHRAALIHFAPSELGGDANTFFVVADGRTWSASGAGALQRSPIEADNLENGKNYSFSVVGKNAFGESKSGWPSNSEPFFCS